MPDNLRITTAVNPGMDVSHANPAAGSSPAAVPVDPAKVPPSPQDQSAGGQTADLLSGRESVFGRFIQQFQKTPPLSGTLQKIAYEAVKNRELIEARQPEDSPLRRFSARIPADRGAMLESMVFQQRDATLFTGPLFQLLEQISRQSGDAQYDQLLAGFLKAFDAYSSAPDMTRAIAESLQSLQAAMPKAYAEKLSALSARLDTADPAGSIEKNLVLLKDEVLPLLGEYMAKTTDYGQPRETVSMLLQQISILNLGEKQNVSARFTQLFQYGKYGMNLPDGTIGLMQSLFAGEVTGRREKQQSELFDALLSLISQGSRQDIGGFDKAIYRDILHSFLLDNSVYMPFQHIILPASIGGQSFFAEMWVEKQNQDAKRRTRGTGPEAQPAASVYLTFEIQSLGYFEARIGLNGKKADLSLAVPAALDAARGEISGVLGAILQQNGLIPGELRLSVCGEPQIPGEILNKIYERKRSVDVTI